MSVYAKEKAEYLLASFASMAKQTVPPAEYVLIVDGPVGHDIEDAIEQINHALKAPFQIIRFAKNMGLHHALRIGIESCSFPLIARMDTDDISAKHRM